MHSSFPTLCSKKASSRHLLSAVVVLLDKDDNALYLRRGPTDPWKPGHWNFPGGKVDAGEWLRHAAQRELREEAGIHVRVSELVPVFSYVEGRAVHIFMARVARRPVVTMADGEHDKFVWAPLTALPQPTIPALPCVASRVLAALTRTRQARTRGNPMWPANYPKYLPFPNGSIRRPRGSVPNQQSVDWPQSQFAPEFLPAGSASFQPYVFNEGYQPLSSLTPTYTAVIPSMLTPQGTYPEHGFDPGTDIASTPYGQARRNSCGCARTNPDPTTTGATILAVLAAGALYWYVTRDSDGVNEERQRRAHTLQGW